MRLPWWVLPPLVALLLAGGSAGLREAGVWRERGRVLPPSEQVAPVLEAAPM